MLSFDFDWPVALAVDLLSSSEDSSRSVVTSYALEYQTDVETTELGVGVRKFWGTKLRPYVGGGLAYVRLDGKQTMTGTLGADLRLFSDTVVDDSDAGLGYWINAGLLYRLGRHVNIGLDLRRSDADAKLSPNQASSSVELDSGGTHYGVMIGYHW
jgi:hypothetical protein